MRHKNISIITVENDLHALAIKNSFENRQDVICNIIEANRLCGSSGLNWLNANSDARSCSIPSTNGDIKPRNIDVIWWRRINSQQLLPHPIENPGHIDLINNDCRTALLGILLNEFRGSWVSHPIATQVSENKIVQLRAAYKAGFQVPQTLVSQNPTEIRAFCKRLDNSVVVKPVKGTNQLPVFTTMISEYHLSSDESLSLCPAIYQEYIAGDKHLRISCFGDITRAVLIESSELDWRRNLDFPIREYNLPKYIVERLQNVLKILGLKMGIFDLKLVGGSDFIWLEVNPQGQFLFVEGLSGIDLTSSFTAFLIDEARKISFKRHKNF